jgi:nucleoside-diphosphate-sugar epimerase
MRIAIAGAHGQIAMKLIPRLVERGDSVVGLIRNPDHADEIRAQGGDPVLCDLEQAGVTEIAAPIDRCDAAVFAAGAGAGSGAERKATMDRDGAIKLLRAAEQAGVPRYVVVSSVGTDNPPAGDDVFSVYLRAKADADAAVAASETDWTILRPGALTNDAGSGHVRLDETSFRGRVPREDVAAVLEALLHDVRASRRTLYLNSGEDTIEDALARLAANTDD